MRFVRSAPAIVGAALLFSGTAHAQAAAKTTRTYDCTKAGNANKAVCKTTASVKPAAVPAKPATMPPAAAAAKTATARNYDCSKAGNANKAACKTAVAAKPMAPVKPTRPVATAPAAAPVAATRVTAAHTATTTKATTTNAAGPNGATAQCKDGTYSKSTHRAGTCAGHKGVATWY